MHRPATRPDTRPVPPDLPTDPPPGALRRWTVFATVSLALLMHAVDQTSVATALSAMQQDLGASLAWTSWTITVYSVGQIIVLPLAGPLGDRFGTRRVFLAGIAGFTLASVACGLSSGMAMLIAGRVVQGLTGGVLLPAGTAIVAAAFGPDRDRAIALFTTVFPFGAILGPVAGGVILTFASWRDIFFINVPVGILLLCAGALVVRRSPRAAAARIDGAGIVLLTALLLAVMVAITQLSRVREGGLALGSVVVAGLVAVRVGAALLRHLRRHPDPVVPPRLLVGRDLGLLNAMNVLFGAAALGFSALLPHYAQMRYGLAPLAAGSMLTARAAVMIAGSATAVSLLRRLGPRPILLVGMGLVTVSLVLTALPPLVGGPELWLAGAAAVMGAGMGLAAPATSNAGMHLVPDKAAAVSGLRVMFRQTGSILAVSLVTATTTAAADPAAANAVAFLALAAVMAVAVCCGARLPNHRGRW